MAPVKVEYKAWRRGWKLIFSLRSVSVVVARKGASTGINTGISTAAPSINDSRYDDSKGLPEPS